MASASDSVFVFAIRLENLVPLLYIQEGKSVQLKQYALAEKKSDGTLRLRHTIQNYETVLNTEEFSVFTSYIGKILISCFLYSFLNPSSKLNAMDMKEEISKRRKEKWYEFIFSIEALAVEKEIVESALKEHVEKMEKAPGIFIYEKNFLEAREVQNPMKDVEKGYSQAVVLKLFIKDLFTSLTAIMLFGPSSVEVFGPDKKEIGVGEVQDIANNVASLVHQFAAAGIGGMVISGKGK